jgi:3-phosphoshikimate 1-carboxyvinyltransferase
LHEPEQSRDHSERMLASMGVDVRVEGRRVTLVPPATQILDPIQMKLPGDISSAAFLVVAALITPGSRIVLQDILLNPTRTGLLDALRAMGADIEIQSIRERNGEPVGDICATYSELNGIQVGGALAVRMIDEFPALAIAAAFAHGRTLVRGAEELRQKESDRIGALCRELGDLGVDITEVPDGFSIQGASRLRGGQVSPSGDHRLAMALAVGGLAAEEPIAVRDAEIIAESFPNFLEALQSLGADARLEA